jgi:uncharacterized protein DUF4386
VPERSDARLYRRVSTVAWIVGPALLLADNVIHPKEFERGNEAKQLAEIASNYTRWQLAHALGFLAIIVFAAAVLGLAFLVRRRQPRLGLVAGALSVAGLIGLGAVITIDGFTWGILGEVSTKPGAQRGAALALHDAQHSDWSYLYYLTPVAFIAGLAALAVGTIRQGAVPVWAGGLLLLAVLMTGTETAIASNAYFIAGAGVMLAAGVAIAFALARLSDEQFAAGGP